MGTLADYRERCGQQTAASTAAVLAAALAESRSVGFLGITREKVAARAGVAVGTVNKTFGTMSGLREAVMSEAVAKEHLDIVAQGLALNDPIAKQAPHVLKVRALAVPLS